MTRLYERAWKLNVGGYDLSNLDSSFSAYSTLKAEPNKATIEVYNLSSTVRGLIEQALEDSKEDALKRQRGEVVKVPAELILQLDAGYKGSTSTIFKGDIVDVQTFRRDSDIVTKIDCGDGEKAYRNQRTQASFRAGTKLGEVANRLGAELAGSAKRAGAKLFKGDISGFQAELNKSIDSTYSVSGSTAAEMTRLLEGQGLTWSTQQGQIQILRRGAALKDTAVVLKKSSGLVSATRNAKGEVSAEILMIPDVFPGRKVRFASEFLTGDYRVDRCTYTGDTAGGAWGISIECRPL